MTRRHILTTVTLLVLVAILAAAAFYGWRSLTGGSTDDEEDRGDDVAGCVDGVRKGEVLSTDEVTVSVYNAGSRSGLASRTRGELEKRGFVAGEVGNAPDDLSGVRVVRVLSTKRNDPSAALVAAQFGPRTVVEKSPSFGEGIEVVLGDGFTGLVPGAPRKLVAKHGSPGC